MRSLTMLEDVRHSSSECTIIWGMQVSITSYLDVISSWCFWSEPAWAELKRRYEGRVQFEWKIALMDATGFPEDERAGRMVLSAQRHDDAVKSHAEARMVSAKSSGMSSAQSAGRSRARARHRRMTAFGSPWPQATLLEGRDTERLENGHRGGGARVAA